jgi:hypothetical protein
VVHNARHGRPLQVLLGPSDEAAAPVVDRLAGPGSQEVLVAAPKEAGRGWFHRRSTPEPEVFRHPELHVFDLLAAKGIDPVVQLGTLEECLTGRPWDEIVEDPRSGHVLASRDEGRVLVLTLTDSLVDALGRASAQQLAEAAVHWSQTEEFWGQADPADLTSFLGDLAGPIRVPSSTTTACTAGSAYSAGQTDRGRCWSQQEAHVTMLMLSRKATHPSALVNFCAVEIVGSSR